MLLQDTICVPRLNIPHTPGVLGIASRLYLSDRATPLGPAYACMSTADAGKVKEVVCDTTSFYILDPVFLSQDIL